MNIQTATITQLKQYVADKQIPVQGDRRYKETYIAAIRTFRTSQTILPLLAILVALAILLYLAVYFSNLVFKLASWVVCNISTTTTESEDWYDQVRNLMQDYEPCADIVGAPAFDLSITSLLSTRLFNRTVT